MKPEKANRFQVSKNEKARARLRRHELAIRVETLKRNIKLHERDVNPDRDLAHLIINWRKELMELKCLGL
jgi:hypothetical protein